MNIPRNEFLTNFPCDQNIIDIFEGSFFTVLPNLKTSPGSAMLADDARITWVNELYPLNNKNILECGPLELGHSYMMSSFGASNITSVEANSYCYMKCLCVKEIFKLNKVELLLGDINQYLLECNKTFDFVLCSGILYHMSNPALLIENISKVTDKVFIWTHIYDKSSNTIHIQKFNEDSFEYSGEKYYGKRQIYQDNGISGKQYCGGCNDNSFWLTKESLFKMLNKYGFTKITINKSLSDLNHVHGPCMSLFCEK
jgi:hypothetical protein